MEEIIQRWAQHLIGRISGPMSFRLYMQPTMAVLLAIRAGLADAREGRRPFLWLAITDPAQRPHVLRQGLSEISRVFILASVLDLIYQVYILKGIFPLECLTTATFLAIVPYFLTRGPASRMSAWLLRRGFIAEKPKQL